MTVGRIPSTGCSGQFHRGHLFGRAALERPVVFDHGVPGSSAAVPGELRIRIIKKRNGSVKLRGIGENYVLIGGLEHFSHILGIIIPIK